MNAYLPKFSGRIPAKHPFHYVLGPGEDFTSLATPGVRIAAKYNTVPNGNQIPIWGEFAEGPVTGFNPAGDCGGNFVSRRYKPNNNCYNYACNIATNSFAQPGRKSGFKTPEKRDKVHSNYILAAESDGLELLAYGDVSLDQVLQSQTYVEERGKGTGHLVALLISEPKHAINWTGDYHWVRCDDPAGGAWSHKTGDEHAIEFDFAGNKIEDPGKACWNANMGPPENGWGENVQKLSEQLVEYDVSAWMFVRYGKVKII